MRVPQCAIEDSKNHQERKGTPRPLGYGPAGVRIAGISADFAKSPANDSCIAAEHVEDPNTGRCQQDGSWHGTMRQVRFLRQRCGRLETAKSQEGKNHPKQGPFPTTQAGLKTGGRFKGLARGSPPATNKQTNAEKKNAAR